MSVGAVLLSSGPSLLGYTPEQGRGRLVVGVNRAATRHACDWWVAGDDQTIVRHRHGGPEPVVGTPSVSTMLPSLDAVERCHRELHQRHQWLHWQVLRDELHPPENWDGWSCTAAVALCVHLGANDIETFGVDMAGTSDFAGDQHCRFSENRWKREREVWRRVVDWAGARGVRVHAGGGLQACA